MKTAKTGWIRITKTGWLPQDKETCPLYRFFKDNDLIIRERGNVVTAYRGRNKAAACVVVFQK